MIWTILTGIVLLILAKGLYNASKLQHIQIVKTVNITSDIETVFNNVVYLKNFPKWSPFLEADPTQKIEIKGTDGQVGAQYHWDGNEGKDLGYQEIKEIKNLEYIKMECDIQKPFNAQPTFEYTFKQEGGHIKVTQDFNLNSSLVDAFFMGIFGVKKDMEKINARGMELLKKVSEE